LVDPNGCPSCKCKPNCLRYCLNGYRYDAAGYQSCDCTCPTINCLVGCPDGYEVDVDGCKTCNCIKKYDTCAKVDCSLGCDFYTQLNGCLDCKCDTKPTCSPMLCLTKCAYGNLYDDKGCPTCNCEPCPPVTCPRYCPYGFAKDISTGCPKCICADKPVCATGGVAGDSLSAPNFCPLKCLKGYELDKYGCPTCTCLPVPPCSCGDRPKDVIKCADGNTYDRYTVCKTDADNKCYYVERKCPIIVEIKLNAGVTLTDADTTKLIADLKASFYLPDSDITIEPIKNSDGTVTTFKIFISADAVPVDKKPEDVRDQTTISLKATGKEGQAYLLESNSQNSFGPIIVVPIIGLFSLLFL